MNTAVYLISVDAHGSEQECAGGEGDDLPVDDEFAGDGAENPFAERHEEDLGGHGHQADHQITHGEVQEEHADSLASQRRLGGENRDEGHIADEGE